jgi:hypothetical protein
VTIARRRWKRNRRNTPARPNSLNPMPSRLASGGVLNRFANTCIVWGDLFNRPVCGFVQSGSRRE